MKKIFFLIIIFFTSFQLNYSQNYQAKKTKIGHVFYLDIPDYMVRTTSLNSSAIVQYMNELLGAYLIVIDDSKEEIQISGGKFSSPKEYFDFFLDGFKTTDTELISERELTINGHKAYQVELKSPIDTFNIFYLITIIESDNYFYNIISWALFDKKDKFKKDYIKIADSFKEE